jgi:hypothetical protein
VPRRPVDLARENGAAALAGIADDEVVDLLPRERIVWTGEPTERRLLRREDALLLPITIIWSVLAISGAVQNFRTGLGGFFAWWGGLFVLIALYLTVGRFVVRAISLGNTRYTLTDQRVVVSGGLTGRAEHTDYLLSLPPPVIVERSDGSGDLAFGSFPGVVDALTRRRGFNVAMWGESIKPPIFRGIPNVRYVRELVVNAQTTARSGRPASTVD